MSVTNLHSGLTLVGTAPSPAAGPWCYNQDSLASPTMAVREPFSSYHRDDRGEVQSIAAICCRAKLCYLQHKI